MLGKICNNPRMKLFLRNAKALSVAVSVLAVSIRSQALTIVSGPLFAKTTNAPLAGLLQLTTDRDSRVSVSSVYRSHRIADLYAHPAQPVADLSVTYQAGVPFLQFSADDAKSPQLPMQPERISTLPPSRRAA